MSVRAITIHIYIKFQILPLKTIEIVSVVIFVYRENVLSKKPRIKWFRCKKAKQKLKCYSCKLHDLLFVLRLKTYTHSSM